MDGSGAANTLARLQKAYATSNLALALSVMTEDVIWDLSGPAEVPYAGVFYGKEGFSRFWWLLRQTVQIHEAGLRTTVYGPAVAVGLGGECGVVKATGRPYHYDWAVEYRFDTQNRISLMRQYYSADRIQAGLRAPDTGTAGGV